MVLFTSDNSYTLAGYRDNQLQSVEINPIPYDLELPPFSDSEPLDIIPPSLNSLTDRISSEGAGHKLEWFVEDHYPGTYQIYLDSLLIDSGSWTNGSITWSSIGIIPGTYNVTIIVWDIARNRSTDTVMVDIKGPPSSLDPNSPYIPQTSNPSPPIIFVPGLTVIPIMLALTVLRIWRRKKLAKQSSL